MPGEIATYLLGAQGGSEDDYPRLYAATNPVLLRYLRVTTDADPAELGELAQDAWATVLLQLKVCPADDDTWLELVVGSAREAAAGRLRTDGVSPVTGPAPTDPDDVDRAIEALRACPPDQADVLAMGVVANLGREATSRLTGHEPGAVLALVHQGQERLAMSFEELIDALRAPARPDEVADLRLVTPLFTAALTRPVPQAAPAAAPIGKGAAWAEAFEASLSEPAPVGPLGMASLAPAPSSAFHLTAVGSPTGTRSRSTKAGVAATVWLVALGGVGTAAAMSGLLTAAVDGILGDHGKPPLVTAEGPVFPGAPATPSTGDGGTAGNPQAQPGAGGGTGGRSRPGTSQAAEQPGTGGGVTQPASLQRGSTVTQVVLASYVVPDRSTPSTPTGSPAAPTTPTTPTTPSGPQTVAPPPASGPVTVGHGSTHGTDKASTRAAKKAAKAAARAARAAARADARATKAHAKSVKAAKAKAAKAKAAKAKAAKAKAAKAHSHHKGTKA